MKKPMKFCNSQQNGVVCMVPLPGKQKNGIQITSMGDFMGMCLFTDENGMQHPDDFMDMYQKNFQDGLEALLNEKFGSK